MAKKRRNAKAGAKVLKIGRRGRKSALSSVSYDELRAELERREELVGAMRRRREVLVAEIEAIDREIGSAGSMPVKRGPGRPRGSGMGLGARRPGPRRGRSGPRPRNAMNLVDALRNVLKGTTMGVTEAVEAVQKSGYKTTSPNFRTIVNQALLANKDAFKKVARGQYTAK